MNVRSVLLLFCVLCISLSLIDAAQAEEQSITIRGEIRVFDGDTIEIGPLLLRLHGVDAPERGQSCASREGGRWRCGAVSSNRVAELIKGRELSCEARDRDPYGRIIAKCDVAGVDIGEVLVKEGLAWAFVEYSLDYVRLEAEAKQSGVGVWQADTQTPWAYRDDKWNRALEASPDGRCPIKGNIAPGKSGSRIYHTPWSPNYGTTKINKSKGERWFCDEAEALAAGWRAVAGR